jgi:hypothetical protein
MSQRSLAQIVAHIEFAYGVWERYEITTGSVTDLLKSLASDCLNITQQSTFIENADDRVLMGCVYVLVCKVRDTCRGHIDEEKVAEEDDQDLADEQVVS